MRNIILDELPYPIAAVYAELDNPEKNIVLRHEALYFTVYQLMRTVGLTLIGQYLTQDLPEKATRRAKDAINRAIARIRCPHYSDWITLLFTLRKYSDQLELDFFPEFKAAMDEVKKTKVEIPREYALGGQRFKDLNLFEAFQALRNSIAHSRMPDDKTIKRDMELFRPLLDKLLGFFAFLKDYELIILKSDLLEDPVIVQHLRGVTPPPPEETEINDALYEAFRFSPVVFKSPLERYQGLFPLFHGHIEGEPIHIYDGHYLLETEKMQRHTIFYFGIKKRTPLDDEEAPDVVKGPAPTDAGRRLLNLLKKKEIPWHIKREEVSPWTIRDIVNDYARRTLADILGKNISPNATWIERN